MKTAPFFLLFSALFVSAQSPGTHEPIRLDPHNSHYLRYQGRTIALITNGEHYGSVINPDFDYHAYLDAIRADGLNYTRLFGGSYIEVPATSFGIRRNTLAPAEGRVILPWARSSQPGFAGGGNKFDLDKWDPEYFRRLNDFLTEAEHRGIIVELTLFSSQYDDVQWKFSPFNSANNINSTTVQKLNDVNTLHNGNVLAIQEGYVRKLVREVGAHPNVIFEIQNEPWSDHPVLSDVVNPYLFPPVRDRYPNSIEVADTESITWQMQVAQWITSEESALPHKHLIAQCYSNFRLPVRSLIPGISILNFHYAYPEAVALNYGLDKAIADDETGFLGRSDDAYRRQAWNFMLSGGSIFDGLDYSFTTAHPDGSDTEPNGPGGGSPAFRKQLGILQKFLASFPLAEMSPDRSAVLYASGVTAHALSSARGAYAIYLDGNGPTSLELGLPAGAYRVEWLNIESGATSKGPDLRSNGRSIQLESPTFDQGIALSLTRVD